MPEASCRFEACSCALWCPVLLYSLRLLLWAVTTFSDVATVSDHVTETQEYLHVRFVAAVYECFGLLVDAVVHLTTDLAPMSLEMSGGHDAHLKI